jgi:glycosyltransferase involved in cell wall biosynthesis
MKNFKKMRVALVYDRVNKWGGAERVLLALHELFPDAPLYTSVYDKSNAGWADVFDPSAGSGRGIRTSFLQKIPFARVNHELLAPLMPLAFESFDFSDFDLVISVASEAAKGIITKPGTRHICYCLTPTRYLWSGYEEYFENKVLRACFKPLISGLRKWDLVASRRPDAYIAISEEVQKRIGKYYGRESELVYPPATLRHPERSEGSREGSSVTPRIEGHKNGYFLIVSRLSKFTKYKRVDLAIEACNKLRAKLVIVGEGNLRNELEEKAGPTIQFAGGVSDKELIEYYKNSKALIFPGYEDLGLTMIEAQSFGKPVIAFGNGGAVELVINNKTGILFDYQTTESLVDAIREFEKKEFEPEFCRKNAKRFSFDNFRKNFMFVIDKLI